MWLDSLPIAQVEAGETITFLHTDHLNTPRLGTDAQGQVVWRWDGTSFGESAPAGSRTVNLRFPGQYYDSETGLHYNWNRYYDPRLGRYVTSDPIGLVAGLNTYAYVDSNPLRFIDPSGLSVVVVDVNRTSDTATATMGQINVGGTNIGCTLELPWRDNKTDISRILPGTYGAKLRTRSDGTRVIELIGVPDRTVVQVHPANYPSELKGCIAPGKTCGKDSTSNSQKAMKEILDLIDFARRVDTATGDVTDIVVRIR